MTTTLEVHPAADLLPLMNDDELQALADDITENGLREPIKVIVEGEKRLILDGRNRLAACKLAGVEPRFEDLNGDDPFSAAISLNVKRRKMLTVGQRAIAAAESWPLVGGKPGRGGDRSANGGDRRLTVAEMARRWEIGETALKQATALVERDPDAAAKVKAGSASLDVAYDGLLTREREAKSDEASLEALRGRHSDLAEMVVSEALSLTEALAAGRERDAELAERRQTRTSILRDLVSAGAKPVDHAAAYVEDYEKRFDPQDEVTPVRLRGVAEFALAVAEIIEKGPSE